MAKEKISEINTTKGKKLDSIDTAQLEYTFTTTLTYGTIIFAVVLGLGSITYMTIQQLKK